MKAVSSRQNPLYRQWLAQLKGSARQSELIALEGSHLCHAWLEHRGQPRWALFDEASLDRAESTDLISLIADPEKIVVLPEKLLRGLSGLKSSPFAIFMVDTPKAPESAAIEQNCVLLDGIQDPGNVGTILRSAVAAGVKQVFTSADTAACWSSKVLRAGQGAQFALEIHEGLDLAALITDHQSQSRPLPVMATCLNTHAKPLFETRLPRDLIWVFGHEGIGVSEPLLSLASEHIYIDQAPGAVQSLNVASAAAICLFEQRRQQQVLER